MNDKIVIRGVYKITRAVMEPAPDPVTGRYPDIVKRVNSQGDMILSEVEKNSGRFFIAENENIEIYDGKTFDLNDIYEAAWWEAIKNSGLIAMERSYRDHQGNLVIDGNVNRYGNAEFYVERPGKESQIKINQAKKIHDAETFIFNDTHEGLYQKARLLNNPMKNSPVGDVQEYLLDRAKKDPDSIIEAYTGTDSTLKLLLLDALDRNVILYKNKQIYQYGDSTVLGASQESVILWMKNPTNARMLSMIKADTYPDFYNYPEVESTVEKDQLVEDLKSETSSSKVTRNTVKK